MITDGTPLAAEPPYSKPKFDTLARDGVRFENTFVTTLSVPPAAPRFNRSYERTHDYTFHTPPIRKNTLQPHTLPCSVPQDTEQDSLEVRNGVAGGHKSSFDVFSCRSRSLLQKTT